MKQNTNKIKYFISHEEKKEKNLTLVKLLATDLLVS